MLDVSAFHRDAFCLVATDGADIVGFANGRVDVEEGLLPGALGRIGSLHVVPEHRGAGVSKALAFWQSLGFVADMVCLSSCQDE